MSSVKSNSCAQARRLLLEKSMLTAFFIVIFLALVYAGVASPRFSRFGWWASGLALLVLLVLFLAGNRS
jgi:hypothetical protein